MVDLNGVNKANAFTCTCQHITSSSLASSVSFPHFFSFSFTCNYLREFLFFDIAYSHGSCVQCSCCQYNSVIGEAFSVAVALVKVIIVCVAPMKCWVLAIRKWNEWNDEEEESICMHMSFFSSDLELLREFIKYWHARSCDDSWSWDVKPKRIHLDCDFIQTHNRSNPSGFSAVRTNSFLSRRGTEYVNAGMDLHYAKFIRILNVAFFLFSHVLVFEWMELAAEVARKGEWMEQPSRLIWLW